jgi:GNAT superfamily N-acetyltransferase
LSIELPPGASSLLQAIRALVRAQGDERDAATLDVLSSFAFQLVVSAEIDLSGPVGFPWDHELRAALSRLGYDTEIHYAEPSDPRFGLMQRRAVDAARTAIDRGQPAMAFGIQVPAFGLVVGYDDARRVLCVSGLLDDAGGPRELSYDRLGRGDVPVLFLMTLGERTPVPDDDAWTAALRAAVEHARGERPIRGDCASGLAAYKAIAAALRSMRIDPSGLALTVQILAEARSHAAETLAVRALSHAGDQTLATAATAYRRVAAATAALAGRLPFPPPPDQSITLPMRDRLLQAVFEIEAADGQAAGALASHLEARVRDRRTGTLHVEQLTARDAPELFRCIGDIPIDGLDRAATACRERIAPRLGSDFIATVLRSSADGRVHGHVYTAALASSGYPVQAAGRQLFLFCPWVRHDLRGSGLGRRLFEAVIAQARTDELDGVLTIATSQEIFLHYAVYQHFGWEEADREEDDRLLYLPLKKTRLEAAPRYAKAVAATHDGRPSVRVRHAYNCPLLHATREGAAHAGPPEQLDVADSSVAGSGTDSAQVTIGPRRLPLGYVPAGALTRYLADLSR